MIRRAIAMWLVGPWFYPSIILMLLGSAVLGGFEVKLFNHGLRYEGLLTQFKVK